MKRRLLGVILLLAAVLPAAAFERRTPVVEAVAKAGPAVVNIRTEQIVSRRASPFGFADPFFDQFFREFAPPRSYTTQSLGTGVIIDPRGFVLTNAHVIAKASRIFVALPDRAKEVEARLVGMAERIDLAIVRIEGEGRYPYLAPARSDDLILGETVIAIGNPLGLGHSVTTGVISAPQRRIDMGSGLVSHFIQTDALINPGNSGGPLLNINGELIGINTAIAQQAQGIGFSIPIDIARRVVRDLIEFGRIRPAYFGIIPGTVNQALTRARGIGGVLVTGIDPGSPAVAAGLELADVILELDGVPVESPEEFFDTLATYTPDAVVEVKVLRGTGTRRHTVTLAPIPADYGLRYGERVFGFAVAGRGGAVVIDRVDPDTPADRAGFRPGDRVAEVGGERVATVGEFAAALEERIGAFPVNFLIVRGQRGYYVDLP